MWFRMAEWIKRGGAIPYDEDLLKELVAPEYYFKNSKIILQSKEEIKDSLGFSPDRADALALTFADVDMPTMSGEFGILYRNESQASQKAASDYDPLDPKRF